MFVTIEYILLISCKKKINFIRYVNHAEDEFSVMRKLNSNEKKNEYISIARYLISKYIKIYESHNVIEPEYQKNFIKNNSTYRIYRDFQEKVNNEAIDLPFSKKKITDINITKLFIDRSVKSLVSFSGKAVVIFIIEQNKEIKNHTVYINFTLSNIRAALDGIVPFKFIIDGYKYK